MSDVKLSLRWFPGRYGLEHADAGTYRLTVGWATVQPKDGRQAWSCDAEGIAETFYGQKHGAMVHLEGLVRDRLIKALAAFGEEKTS